MNTQFESQQKENLYAMIQSRTGLTLDEARHEIIDQILSQSILNPTEYAQMLMLTHVTKPIWQEIVQRITIGETYFFRNRSHFDALKTHIFPQLIEQRRRTGMKQLRIWSAACSTGEEPYSIAMLLRELIPDIDDWAIFILGSDINQNSLNRAGEGLYGTNSFRNETPDYIKSRWFQPEGKLVRLDQTIRDMVSFTTLNLISDDYPSLSTNTMNMDLIFCRNATIYFDRPQTRKVIRRFWQSLQPEGWLVVGHSEPNSATYIEFEPRNLKNTVIYYKNSGGQTLQNQASENSKEHTALHTYTKDMDSVPGAISRIVEHPVNIIHREASDEVAEDSEPWMRAKKAADHGQWDQALRYLDELGEDKNMNPETHYLRALLNIELSDADAAIFALRRAIYCDPNFALAHYTLGEVYAARGDSDTAMLWWRRAYTTIRQWDSSYSLIYDEEFALESLLVTLESRLARLPRETVQLTRS